MDWWIRSNNAVYLPQTQQLLVLVHLDVDASRNVSFLFEVKLHSDGVQWIPLFELMPSDWTVLYRLNADTALIAANTLDDQELLIFKDNRIQQRRVIDCHSFPIDIYADSKQVHVLGYRKEINYMDATGSVREELPARFNAIHGVPGEFVVVVGEDGAVGLRKHGQWSFAIDSPTNLPLLSVYCHSVNEIYIGGMGGAGFRWDGDQRWEEINFPKNVNVQDFLELNGVIYASAEEGIFRIQGDNAERISELGARKLFTLPNNKLGVTLMNSAGIAILDGDQWVVHEYDVLNHYATQLEELLKTMPY